MKNKVLLLLILAVTSVSSSHAGWVAAKGAFKNCEKAKREAQAAHDRGDYAAEANFLKQAEAAQGKLLNECSSGYRPAAIDGLGAIQARLRAAEEAARQAEADRRAESEKQAEEKRRAEEAARIEKQRLEAEEEQAREAEAEVKGEAAEGAMLERKRIATKEGERVAKEILEEEKAVLRAQLKRLAEEEEQRRAENAARQAEWRREAELKIQAELKRQVEWEKRGETEEKRRADEVARRAELKRQAKLKRQAEAQEKRRAEEVARQAELKRQEEEAAMNSLIDSQAVKEWIDSFERMYLLLKEGQDISAQEKEEGLNLFKRQLGHALMQKHKFLLEIKKTVQVMKRLLGPDQIKETHEEWTKEGAASSSLSKESYSRDLASKRLQELEAFTLSIFGSANTAEADTSDILDQSDINVSR